MNIEDKAQLLIKTFSEGLKDGVQHYRKSDGKLLVDVYDIMFTLREENELTIIFPRSELWKYGKN